MDKLLPGIRKKVLLKNYTTFKIGGPAKYFFIAKTKKDLISAIKTAKKIRLPFFIFGGGSNLLVSDGGYNGLVVKMENKKYQVENNKIFCEAGVLLSRLVTESTNYGLAGLEWAAGLPGTLGGAIYGNAGWPSNKKNISSIVESVEVLKVASRKLQVISYANRDCQFGYRESVFKKNKNLIILNAILKLKKGNKKNIKKEIADIIKKRGKKIPAGFSAGSVFKNFTPYRPVLYTKFIKMIKQTKNLGGGVGVESKELEELKKFKEIGIIPAAWLIEKCGLKGKKIGNAKISEKHANFIINLGNAEAKDVKSLISLAKKAVKNKFHVELEEEIQYSPPKF